MDDLSTVVYGYRGIRFTLEMLRNICPSKDEIKKQIAHEKETHEKQKALFDFQEKYKEIDDLPDEVWVKLPQNGWENVYVSEFARIKVLVDGEFKILEQKESSKKDEEIGYLVVKSSAFPEPNREYHVYTLVAMAFLGKKVYEGDGFHVHHINNDGYNCRPDNLILLNENQHLRIVHHT